MQTTFMYQSDLWKRTLGVISIADEKKPLERLRVALDVFRTNCELIANDISRDLPDFTVHDMTHIDSLWEMASLIVGDKYPLNPAEAFVLGGAILLHDLGLAASAYAEGLDELCTGKQWEDCLELFLVDELGRTPTVEEREHPSDIVRRNALEYRLRELHAVHAEKLPLLNWKTTDGRTYRLLEDNELLEHFAEAIGKIAASHWWSLEEVERNLAYPLGAPPSFPPNWNIDLLKIACIIRCADASHIDSRRAPGLLRAIRRPKGESEKHWRFQERIARPIVKDNLLVYSSRQRFSEEDVNEWWLAFDTLKMIDSELSGVDKLLKEKQKDRFCVVGIMGIDSPTKLSSYILASNWTPVDTSIHISNIPSLVSKLGGNGLYGESPYVPLRELIQNARDAVTARRKLHKKDDSWGKILVSLGKDHSGDYWIQVEDDGIGMTERTLTEVLLDFGKSYWGSNVMLQEQPGLLSSGYTSVGEFGIGFYSVFMWSNRIEVTTRSIHKGPDDTIILNFINGLNINPIIKKVKSGNGMNEPGTKVRVYLKDKDIISIMVHYLSSRETPKLKSITEEFHYICRKLVPSLDVDLDCKIFDDNAQSILKAGDWEKIDSVDLVLRVMGYNRQDCPPLELELATRIAPYLTSVNSNSGELIGRLGLLPFHESDFRDSSIGCSVTAGGIYAGRLQRMFGIVKGKVTNASRNDAIPLLYGDPLSQWASEQSTIFSSINAESLNSLQKVADSVNKLGGFTGTLPICKTNKGLINLNQVVTSSWPDKIAFISNYEFTRLVGLVELSPDVIVVDTSGLSFSSSYFDWPKKHSEITTLDSLRGLVIKGIAQSKGISQAKIEEKFNHKGYVWNQDKWIVGLDSRSNEIMYSATIVDFSEG